MTDMTENMAQNKTMTVSCICFISNAEHRVILYILIMNEAT
jgi:hypothetical protein